MRAYRGEHGPRDKPLNTRKGSLTFSSYAVAETYATMPNDLTDVVIAPVVLTCNLVIKQPFVISPGDAHINFGRLVEIIGVRPAQRWFCKMQRHVMRTDYWVEHFSEEFEDVRKLYRHNPELLYGLFVLIWPLLDDQDFINRVKGLGYDGAIYRGSACSEQTLEYRVFSERQVTILSETRLDIPAKTLDRWFKRESCNG